MSRDRTFFEKCSGTSRCFLLGALKGHHKVAHGKRGGRSPSRRPGSMFPTIFSSPPESPGFGRFGGRGWVRGAIGCPYPSLVFRYSLNVSQHEA
jgi:hypothetical protein